MASEPYHHVGYSRENECWFVRFYPYQTEQQAIEAIAEFTRPTPVAPVSPDVTGKCGELVTVETQYRSHGLWTPYRGMVSDKNAPVRYLVDRSQAVELLAAERAEREIAERNRDAARENFLTMQKSSAKLLKRAEKAEADNAAKEIECAKYRDYAAEKSNQVAALQRDNAALTARVKELTGDRDSWRRVAEKLAGEKQALEAKLTAAEAGRDRVRRIFRRNTRLRFEAEKRAAVIEAKLGAAEKTAFEHGYVLACCNIINLHDEPTIAHDTLSELGVTRSDIKAMNLSEFDLKALRKIEGGCSGSPYAKTKRKARAALGGKPS